MHARCVTVTVAFLVASAAPVQAQSIEGGVLLAVGVPSGVFRRNVSHAGIGALLNIGYAPEESPFMLGGEFGFYQYGSTTSQRPVSGPGPTRSCDATTANRIFTGGLFVRLQSNVGWFRPYIQGHVGGTMLWTETTVEDPWSPGRERSSIDNLRDGAYAYGGGAGVRFQIVHAGPETEGVDVFVEAGARYTFGGKAKYYQEGDIDPGGAVRYRYAESETDLLTVALGVAVRF